MKNILTKISTITTKYQTVVPREIREALGLKTSHELMWQVVPTREKPLIVVSPRPVKWSAYLSGLGKRVWEGVDTDAYIKKLRKEWQT